MLLAVGKNGDRKLLIIGLQKENIHMLVNDQPIYKNLADEGAIGLEEWDVTILGPEDTFRFVAHFEAKEEI